MINYKAMSSVCNVSTNESLTTFLPLEYLTEFQWVAPTIPRGSQLSDNSIKLLAILERIRDQLHCGLKEGL